VDVVITKKGLEVLGILESQIMALNQEMIHLDEKELLLLNGLLDKLRG
jgi:hypothetical protein